MPITITPADSGATIRIDGELTIYTAADNRQLLCDALVAHPALTVELDAIDEIDTSGVQLLLMLVRDARTLGKVVVFNNASAAVQEVASLLNLGELHCEVAA